MFFDLTEKVDPLDMLIAHTHELSIDCLAEACKLKDPVRLLWLREQLEQVAKTIMAASDMAGSQLDKAMES